MFRLISITYDDVKHCAHITAKQNTIVNDYILLHRCILSL